MGLTPAFLVLHLQGKPGLALGCFILAAVSDVLDGFLARILDQRSKLGALLDPIADKLLSVAALSSLTLEGRLPPWLFVLVLVRDGYMILLAAVVHVKRLEVTVEPTRVGKYATFALIALVVLALLDEMRQVDAVLHAYTRVVGVTAGLCVALSTLQYFVRFGYLLTARSEEVRAQEP